MDLKKLNGIVEMVGGMTGDDLLGAIGLERRRSVVERMLPALGFFGLGVVLGASMALLLAPRTGKDLRHQIFNRFGELRSKVQRELQPETGAEARSGEAARSTTRGSTRPS